MKAATLASLMIVFSGIAIAYPLDVVLYPRIFNDDPNSTLEFTATLPDVHIRDSNLVGDGVLPEYANRHIWYIADWFGADPRIFNIDSYFTLKATVRLDAFRTSPRNCEGGLWVKSDIGGEGQFILTSDGEVAAFGGSLPFYVFSQRYTKGTSVEMSLRYFLDLNDNQRYIEYMFDGNTSGPLLVDNLEQGLPGDVTIGGYQQATIIANQPDNFGQVDFTNVTWNSVPLGTPFADTDNNGCIDDADITNIILDFGGPPSGSNGLTDVDNSNEVDDTDLTLAILEYGAGC